MAGIDGIADRLAHEVAAKRPAALLVALEQRPLRGHVVRLGQGAVDLEVVAPARELEPFEPPRGRQGCELVKRQIGPLAGEQRHRSCHSAFLLLPCRSSGAARVPHVD